MLRFNLVSFLIPDPPFFCLSYIRLKQIHHILKGEGEKERVRKGEKEDKGWKQLKVNLRPLGIVVLHLSFNEETRVQFP